MASGLAVSKSESYLFSPSGKFVAHKKNNIQYDEHDKMVGSYKTIKDSSP